MARILLVDDNRNLLNALDIVLRNCGHEVTTTNSGADAVCLLSSKPPSDLLVLDLEMPGFNGYDVVHKLGPTAPPTIIISGSGEDPSKLGTDIIKATRFLPKPFDLEPFLKMVAECLGDKADCTCKIHPPDPCPNLEKEHKP
jgi:CheY-like chemotaxis protein